MKRQFWVAIFVAFAGDAAADQVVPDALCAPLRNFVDSVAPNQSEELSFHTNWGVSLEDSKDPTFYGKRCDHHGYEPARAVCDYLIDYGAVEFAANNVKRVLSCLSPDTRFAPKLGLKEAEFTLIYGASERQSAVTIKFGPDTQFGGNTLKITAEGY